MSKYRKLRKSRDHMLAGVAGGIAECLGWQPKQVRIIWFIAGLFTAGTALLVYTICAFVFPPPSDFDINDFREQ